MDRTDWKEVRDVIASNGSNKSAGWDGVNCDLVELHSESSDGEPSPLLEILTHLINISLGHGKTLKSWRKAIISMIPKRKDDGALTTLIGEMRPISSYKNLGKFRPSYFPIGLEKSFYNTLVSSTLLSEPF